VFPLHHIPECSSSTKAESHTKPVAVKNSKSVFPTHFKLSYNIKSSESSLNSQTIQASFATRRRRRWRRRRRKRRRGGATTIISLGKSRTTGCNK